MTMNVLRIESTEVRPMDVLCQSCSKHNIRDELFLRNIGTGNCKLRIKYFKDAKEASKCPLCRLFVAAILLTPGAEELDKTSGMIMIDALPIGRISGPQPEDSPGYHAGVIWVQLFFGGQNWSEEQNGTVFSHGIQILANEDGTDVERLLRGRRITSDIDFGRLKSWIRTCSTHHQANCLPTSLSTTKVADPNDGPLRLVDVEQKCIVDAAYENRYVALSYVWGNPVTTYPPNLELTDDNYDRLTRAGGLDNTKYNNIPRTISDAMLVCQQLGERFLWVDALCIHKTKKKEREMQIRAMASIYKSAFFTIVNASGKDVNAYIPGLLPNSRKIMQHSEIVDGIELITCQRPYLASVSKSEWNTRGWTYEEKVLSNRLLIFTDYQAFYHCNSALWYEDTILESEGTALHVDLDENEGALNRRGDGKTPAPGTNPIRQYHQFVEGYTRRRLTKATDGLKAFRGIISTLQPVLSSRFFMGIPEAIFDMAIAWAWVHHFPEKQFAGLPTWTWASWMNPDGNTDNMDPYWGPPQDVESLVIWYRIDPASLKNQDYSQLSWLKINNEMFGRGGNDHDSYDETLAQYNLLDAWNGNGIPRIVQGKLDHILCFWTTSAMLYVDFMTKEYEESNHAVEDHQVRISKGQTESLGIIRLDKNWRWSRGPMLEFILICRSLTENPGKHPVLKIELPDLQGIVTLLIERDENDDRFARRIKRSRLVFNERMWHLAKPQRKLILLI